MAVIARLKVSHITDFGGHREVFFEAVYSDDKKSPNYSFSKFTPQASMKMVITNPDAYEQFKSQGIYDLTFEEAKIEPKA